MAERTTYIWEAVREPANIWAMAALVMAAVFLDPPLDLVVLAGGAVAEALYLTFVPATAAYRRLVDQRRRRRAAAERERAREELIKSFDPREREAVEYLRWLKKQIYTNYLRFTRAKEVPADIRTLDALWERFVDFLDLYRRCKTHLRAFNRQAIENQIAQAERALQTADERTRRVLENNVTILRGRLAEYESIERAAKLLEVQLQSIENFFGLVNDKVMTMSSVESIASLDFESVLSSIEVTRSILEETAPIMRALEAIEREPTTPWRSPMTSEHR